MWIFWRRFLFLASILMSSQPAIADWQHIPTEIEKKVGKRPVQAFHIDNQGKTWVGLQGGLLLFDDTKSQAADHLNPPWSADVVDIGSNSQGDVFVLTRTQGVYYKSSLSENYKRIVMGSIGAERYAKQLLIDGTDHLWLMYDNLLVVMNAARPANYTALKNADQHEVSITSNLLLLDHETVCFGSIGTIICTNTKLLRRNIASLPNKPKIDAGASGVQHLALSHGSNKIVFATDTGTIGVVDPNNIYDVSLKAENISFSSQISSLSRVRSGYVALTENTTYLLDSGFTLQHSLKSQELQQLIDAHESGDGIWIISLTGLRLLNDIGIRIWPERDNQSTLNVTSFAETESMDLFIAGYSGKIFRTQKANPPEEVLWSDRDHTLKQKQIMSLATMNDHLIVGTLRSGILTSQLANNGKLKPIDRICNGEGISALKTVGDWLLIGTSSGKLLATSEIPKKCPKVIAELSRRTPVTSISVSPTGDRALVTTEDSVFGVCFENDPFVCEQHHYDTEPTHMRFLSSCIDDTGAIWLGTLNDGLYRTDPDSGDSTRKLIKQARNDIGRLAIYTINCSGFNDVWISTGNGLWSVRRSGEAARQLSISEGIPTTDFNHGSSIVSSRGRIFFGNPFGFVSFTPSDLTKSSHNRNVFLRAVIIKNIRGGKRLTTLATDLVEIDAWKSSIRVVVSLNDFRNPDANQYFFRLDGLEESWLQSGSINEVAYGSLPPGDFELLAKGVDASGIASNNTIRLPIRVRPPWWSATHLKGAAVLVVGFLMYAARIAWARVDTARRERIQEKELLSETEARLDLAFELAEDRETALKEALNEDGRILEISRSIVAYYSVHSRHSEWTDKTGRWALDRIESLRSINSFSSLVLSELSSNLYSFTEEQVIALEQEFCDVDANVVLLNNIADHRTPKRHSVFLALVLHELIRNVFEHAFIGRPPDSNIASVYLEQHRGDGRPGYPYTIRVEDNGVGARGGPLTPPFTQGGLGFIAQMISAFDGQMEVIDAAGTTVIVHMTFPEIE